MRNITVIFILLIAVAITVYDVFAILKGGTESSISMVMIQWAYQYPLFPFGMGVLVGHLFWRVRDIKGVTGKLK